MEDRARLGLPNPGTPANGVRKLPQPDESYDRSTRYGQTRDEALTIPSQQGHLIWKIELPAMHAGLAHSLPGKLLSRQRHCRQDKKIVITELLSNLRMQFQGPERTFRASRAVLVPDEGSLGHAAVSTTCECGSEEALRLVQDCRKAGSHVGEDCLDDRQAMPRSWSRGLCALPHCSNRTMSELNAELENPPYLSFLMARSQRPRKQANIETLTSTRSRSIEGLEDVKSRGPERGPHK